MKINYLVKALAISALLENARALNPTEVLNPADVISEVSHTANSHATASKTSFSDILTLVIGYAFISTVKYLGNKALPIMLAKAQKRNNQNKDWFGLHWKSGTELLQAMQKETKNRKNCAGWYCDENTKQNALNLLKKIVSPKNESKNYNQLFDQLKRTNVDYKGVDQGYTPFLLGIKNHKHEFILQVLDIIAPPIIGSHSANKIELTNIFNIKDRATKTNTMLISAIEEGLAGASVKEGLTEVVLRVLKILKPLLRDDDAKVRDAAYAVLKAKNGSGYTFLNMAAKCGNWKVVEAALDLGFDEEKGVRIPEVDHELLDLIGISTGTPEIPGTSALMWTVGRIDPPDRTDKRRVLATIEGRAKCFDLLRHFLKNTAQPNFSNIQNKKALNENEKEKIAKILKMGKQNLEDLIALLEKDEDKTHEFIQKACHIIDMQKAFEIINHKSSTGGTAIKWVLLTDSNGKEEKKQSNDKLTPEQIAKEAAEEEKKIRKQAEQKKAELPIRIKMRDNLSETSLELEVFISKEKIELLKINKDVHHEKHLAIKNAPMLTQTELPDVLDTEQKQDGGEDTKIARKEYTKAARVLKQAKVELEELERNFNRLPFSQAANRAQEILRQLQFSQLAKNGKEIKEQETKVQSCEQDLSLLTFSQIAKKAEELLDSSPSLLLEKKGGEVKEEVTKAKETKSGCSASTSPTVTDEKRSRVVELKTKQPIKIGQASCIKTHGLFSCSKRPNKHNNMRSAFLATANLKSRHPFS